MHLITTVVVNNFCVACMREKCMQQILSRFLCESFQVDQLNHFEREGVLVEMNLSFTINEENTHENIQVTAQKL